MLKAYSVKDGALVPLQPAPDSLASAAWVDLLCPTPEEEALVEQVLGIEVPTREEMREIEPSSRLYVEKDARFLTAAVVAHSASGTPKVAAVTSILAEDRLITVRYHEPAPFALFCARAAKIDQIHGRGEGVFFGLLDTIIDRLADILESVGDEIDTISQVIFAPDNPGYAKSYKEHLRQLGQRADLVSKVRESLVSHARLLLYLGTEVEGRPLSKEASSNLPTMRRDIEALSMHVDYLTNKTQLLLDAVVGMVSIEQNNIIKIFAVLSVVLMPPTLVASIYGMNFRAMPELQWPWGYPAALVLMAVAGALPYLYFKWKKWL